MKKQTKNLTAKSKSPKKNKQLEDDFPFFGT